MGTWNVPQTGPVASWSRELLLSPFLFLNSVSDSVEVIIVTCVKFLSLPFRSGIEGGGGGGGGGGH